MIEKTENKKKIELTPDLLADDIKAKLRVTFGESLAIFGVVSGFFFVLALVFLPEVLKNPPDTFAFNQLTETWWMKVAGLSVLVILEIFAILLLAQQISNRRSWERGDFYVVSARLTRLRVRWRRGYDDNVAPTYMAYFGQYGVCYVTKADADDPFDSEIGDEFYIVLFKSLIFRDKYTAPILSYSKKKYEYND